jgi:hypothetical protein
VRVAERQSAFPQLALSEIRLDETARVIADRSLAKKQANLANYLSITEYKDGARHHDL